MEKTITTNENNIIKLNTEENYCYKVINIEKNYINNGKIEKKISFAIWDDIRFDSYLMNQNIHFNNNEITYEIKIEDQIYFALNRLLGKEGLLIIDDDHTKEQLKKYIKLQKDYNRILITFHDEVTDKFSIDRFSVFIKNIGPDPRSKIKDINIKYRLIDFFKEAEEILTNEFHQYTLDETFELMQKKYKLKGNNPFLSKTNKNTGEYCLNCNKNCITNINDIYNWCENYIPNEKTNYINNPKQKIIKKQ